LSRIFLLLVCVFSFARPAAAWEAPSLHGVYGELQFAFAGVQHSDVEFNPGFASLSAGAWLWKGIGLEAHFDQGLNDGRDGDFNLEISEAGGVALRFQGPASEGVFAYVVVGIVNTQIEQVESASPDRRTVVQSFRGGRISIGLGGELSAFPGVRVLGEYRNYFVDEDLEIDALTIGLQVSFQ